MNAPFQKGDLIVIDNLPEWTYIAGGRNPDQWSQLHLLNTDGQYVTTVHVSRVTRNITSQIDAATDELMLI